MDAGIAFVKGREVLQKNQMQSRFACGNGDTAGLQTAVLLNLGLAQPQLLICRGNTPVQT